MGQNVIACWLVSPEMAHYNVAASQIYVLEFDLLPYTEASMAELLQLGLESCQNQLEEIAKEAEMEEKLRTELDSIVQRWEQVCNYIN